jgi:hypothetical protein
MSPGSSGAAGAANPGTPSRLGQPLAPSVVISPSAPVRTRLHGLEDDVLTCSSSIFPRRAQPRQCLAIFSLPKPARNR